MSLLPGAHWIWVIAVVCTSTGCAYGEMREVLRTSLASEHDCPEMRVSPRNPAQLQNIHPQYNDQYHVTGCGVDRTYTCPVGPGLQEYGAAARCSFVEGDPDAPKQVSLEPEAAEDAVPSATD